MRIWRTIFSISTIASSTSTPATNASASSDRKLRLNPSRSMKKKVGIADNGIATALMKVARQSRRNRNTTTTARTAPSTSAQIEVLYWARV